MNTVKILSKCPAECRVQADDTTTVRSSGLTYTS